MLALLWKTVLMPLTLNIMLALLSKTLLMPIAKNSDSDVPSAIIKRLIE